MTQIHRMPRTASSLFVALLLLCCGRGLLAQFVAPAPTSSEGLNIQRVLTTDPAVLYPINRELQLMSGDLLTVTIFGTTPQFTASARVSLDGTIRLPLAGVIKVIGLSLEDAEAAIAARMEQLEMYRNPQVTIQVTEAPGHVATVLGSAKDGLVPILSRKRLYDVLAFSGGIPATSSPVVTIERPGLTDPIVVDLGSDPTHSAAANIPVFAGDTVTLGTVGGYYVFGAVKAPGLQRLNGVLPTTAMQAIAVSGGGLYQARLDSTKLIRTTGSQRSVIEVPLKKVLNGQAPDPILQADDILFVPTNALKAALTVGGVSAVLGLVIAAISVTRY